MLHRLALLLVAQAVCAAAVAPTVEATKDAAEPAPTPEPVSRLEQLVSSMAAGQQTLVGAQSPNGVEDVVIFEGEENRRQLAKCRCDDYRNGAVAGMPTCVHVENGRRICQPQQNGKCDSRMIRCSGYGPAASPTPYAAEEEVEDLVYLNVDLVLSHPTLTSPSHMPSADAFAVALADLADVSREHVHTLTSFATQPMVKSAAMAPPIPGGSQITVYATFALKGARRSEALETLLQLSDTLRVAGTPGSFELKRLEVNEASSRPLVCSAGGEGLKAQAASLLHQLVSLKEAELSLLRQMANTPPSDCGALNKVAGSLGVDTLLR